MQHQQLQQSGEHRQYSMQQAVVAAMSNMAMNAAQRIRRAQQLLGHIEGASHKTNNITT
jgi:hypothetical protein